MKLYGTSSLTSIGMAIVFIFLSYDICMEEPRLGGSLVRRCALNCVNIVEKISLGLVNIQKRLSEHSGSEWQSLKDKRHREIIRRRQATGTMYNSFLKKLERRKQRALMTSSINAMFREHEFDIKRIDDKFRRDVKMDFFSDNQECIHTSWIQTPVLFQVYQVKRAFQTIRHNFNKIPDNMQVEVTRIAVNGRPALHHCPEGDFSKHLLPGIVYFHGGSWISGSAVYAPDTSSAFEGFNPFPDRKIIDWSCRRRFKICIKIKGLEALDGLIMKEWTPLTTYLTNTSKVIVISIDYRLAPEHKFPAAFEDGLKATLGILEAAEQYGVDPKSIAIAGDDVGANLALAIALNISKDRDKYPERSHLKLVGMFYPILQAFDFTLPSYVRYRDGLSFHNTDDIIMGSLSYLVGDADDWVIKVISTSSHVTKELKESAFYKAIFDVDLLPFSFRQWRVEPELLFFVNQTLENEIRNLVQDTRFSAMLAPSDDLALLPNTYFICPEFDPRRDDSFFAYARFLELDSSNTEHIYYDSEKYGFLLEVASNNEARLALEKFSKHFENVLNTFQNNKEVERSVFSTDEESPNIKESIPTN